MWLSRAKADANFISSDSKIVKRLRRRQYDPAIFERTIGIVLGSFTALLLYSFLQHILLYTFVYHIFMTSPIWLAVGPQSL